MIPSTNDTFIILEHLLKKDGYLEYIFYNQDNLAMITINLYEFIENNLEDNLYDNYLSYQNCLQ